MQDGVVSALLILTSAIADELKVGLQILGSTRKRTTTLANATP